jgi:hypothetical protein
MCSSGQRLHDSGHRLVRLRVASWVNLAEVTPTDRGLCGRIYRGDGDCEKDWRHLVGGVEFFQHLDRVAIGRVELKGLLVIGYGELFVAVVHVSFREAIISVA